MAFRAERVEKQRDVWEIRVIGNSRSPTCGRTVGPEDPTEGQLGNLVSTWGG